MVLAALISLAAAPPQTAAIVWGGGKSRAEAEAWSTALSTSLGPFSASHTPANGYPRIVESAKVKGMKPGFHVVVLGVCPVSQLAGPLKFYKAIYAGTYARKVSGLEPGCPEVKANVTHSQSISAEETLLTMSALQTPQGEMLRATHVSKAGKWLAGEGFDTPRKAACIGGFRRVGEAFEVTLCSSTQEKNICCASPKLLTLTIEGGKLTSKPGPVPPPAPPPPDENARDCSRDTLGDYVLETCVDSELDHGGGGFVERGMSGTLWSGPNRYDLGSWSKGWEWGTRWSLLGSIPIGKGRSAIVVSRMDYGEGPSLGSQTTSAWIYGPELGVMWSASANDLGITVTPRGLTVKARTYLSGEEPNEEIETEYYEVVWKNGAFVRKP